MMNRPLAIAGAMAALAAGLAVTAAPAQDRAERRAAALADARPVGDPVNCVTRTQIKETRVRSDDVIDFFLRDGRVLRNTLPARCPGLGFDERFSYKTSQSQLCSVDIITVLQSPGITPGASCGLGQFQPIETTAK